MVQSKATLLKSDLASNGRYDDYVCENGRPISERIVGYNGRD